MLTVRDWQDDKVQALEADDYITKPFRRMRAVLHRTGADRAYQMPKASGARHVSPR
jgi:DNA-binding response OmpR family regulator